MKTIALCGLGPDSHSVGLIILSRALDGAGYRVVDLGIQNDFDRLAAAAEFCDAILVSNMDGHSAHYFADLEHLPGPCLWYLGGNPSIDDNLEPLRRLNFKRIYADYVGVDQVLAALRDDLPDVAHAVIGRVPPRRQAPPDNEGRDAVLGMWPTGAGARDIEENAECLSTRASLSAIQMTARKPLLQPRIGVAESAAQLSLFRDMWQAGAEVLSFQIDSLTRDGQYDEVSRVLNRRGQLNGFPLVNHGVKVLREISAAVPTPMQTRHSARDPRLLAELTYAGGVTGFEGGAICYNLPYYADLPLRTSLSRWQYVDRLAARYTDFGIIVDREFFGTLTATLVPPFLAITTNLLEGLLAVAEGVQSVSLAYAEQGCRTQDIAAMRVMRRLGDEMLGRKDTVNVATVFHQFMGAFPDDTSEAKALIENSATTAALSQADRVLVKAPCESRRIPGATANAMGLALAARGTQATPEIDNDAIEQEEKRIEASVRLQLETVLATHRDLPGAIADAFARGLLDVPFSPSIYNAGRFMTARDSIGAVRVLDWGAVPVPPGVRAFEDEQMDRRLAEAGISRDASWQLVADSVRCTHRQPLSWPLDATSDLWAGRRDASS